MRVVSLTILLLVFKACLFGQTDREVVNFINPSFLSAPRGYSHAVDIDLGTSRMLIISGQVALDNKGNLVGGADMAKQTEQVFMNLKTILESAGGTMDNVVKTGIFVTDLSQLNLFRDVRNKFVNQKNPPASTLVQVSRLFREDLLIEIEATAIIPKIEPRYKEGNKTRQ